MFIIFLLFISVFAQYRVEVAYPNLDLPTFRSSSLSLVPKQITDVYFFDKHTFVSYEDGLVVFFENSYQTNTYQTILEIPTFDFKGISATETHIHVKYSTNTTEKIVEYTHQNFTLNESRIISEYNCTTNRGSKVHIDKDIISFGLGDCGNATAAIDINSVYGKIIRMNITDGIHTPSDNPFGFVWAYGFRDPNVLSFSKGDLYTSTVGAAYGSIYKVTKSGFHGWNRRDGIVCYNPPTNCGWSGSGRNETFPLYLKEEYLIGGLVVKGNLYPEIENKYIYSNITHVFVDDFSIEMGIEVRGFSQDSVGRLFIHDGREIYVVMGENEPSSASIFSPMYTSNYTLIFTLILFASILFGIFYQTFCSLSF